MTSGELRETQNNILAEQIQYANAELQWLSSSLWGAVGYNQDPIAFARETFPTPAQRRSDTEFTCTPEQELYLRQRAAELGPGRPGAEALKELGVERVDAEIIEPGQLHKTVTELWLALDDEQTAPIIVFASDRQIPLWIKDKDKNDTDQVDLERLSSLRLLTIGGKDLSGVRFFHRAGRFDERAAEQQEQLKVQSLAIPLSEYEITEQFLRTAVDETLDTTLPVGYDPENGQLVGDRTGQVRMLGTINGRDVILVHKQKRQDGSALDTTATILLTTDIAAAITGKERFTTSYYTSATYKPSRLMSGIRAGLVAAQNGKHYRIVVPTYGYEDLAAVRGDENPAPPLVQQIAGELGQTAKEAGELRDFLTTL